MKKFILISILIIVLVVALLTIVKYTTTGNLISPVSEKSSLIIKESDNEVKEAENTLPNSPKTFKFDSSTDLKAELGKVDPKILDSDFE